MAGEGAGPEHTFGRTVPATPENVAPLRRARVSDLGQGMVPRPDSPGLGLGLPLIASIMTAWRSATAPAASGRPSSWGSDCGPPRPDGGRPPSYTAVASRM